MGHRTIGGITDLQALAVAAIAALEEADLTAEAQLIHARVLSRAPQQLLEQVSVNRQTVWMFTPMVELLMHELRDVATTPGLSREQKRERIRWTLDAAGF